jgi:hypothetical protein
MHPSLPSYVKQADALHHAVRGLSHVHLVAPPATKDPSLGAWTIKEVVVHLWHSDLAATHRMTRIAAEDRPLLIAYDETAFVRTLSYNDVDTQTVCELFRLNRLHTADMLKRLPSEMFSRQGIHNQRGIVTLGQLVEMYVHHVDHHVGFIARKRAALGV